MVYRNSSLDMPGRIAHMHALCASEPGPGVLAYVDGEVAGWCSVAPKSTYRALVNSRTIPHVQDRDAWSVVCFVVRPGFRRRGLMHQLLDGAVRHAHARGATALEGYPVDPGSERTDQTSGYVGTVQLFEAHGFERVRQTAGRAAASPAGLCAASFPDLACCLLSGSPQVLALGVPPASGDLVAGKPAETRMNDLCLHLVAPHRHRREHLFGIDKVACARRRRTRSVMTLDHCRRALSRRSARASAGF